MVSASFLVGVGTRVVLTAVFVALANLAYYRSQGCVSVSPSQGAVVMRNPLRRVTLPFERFYNRL